MSTWRDVHAGDIVLGHDGQEWGVLARAGDRITLTRFGNTLTGQPEPSASVIITQAADLSAERTAAEHLLGAGFMIEIVSESVGESA